MNLDQLTQQIQQVQTQLEQETLTELDQLKTKYLGKNGQFNTLAKSITQVDQADRKIAGRLLNDFKQILETKLTTAANSASLPWTDLTLPGKRPKIGHVHPISQAMNEITHIFEKIGFTRARYPEVDWDWYVFEALNMPPAHPARDEWETFFVTNPDFASQDEAKSVDTSDPAGTKWMRDENADNASYDPLHPRQRHPNLLGGKIVMTTHTSNGQVREMERLNSQPPIRMINIARCYRRQQDATHTQMFHQFEGLVVDKDINIQHLKGTLDYFAEEFYGPGTKSRIRPFHFQFTEPSFEVDFSCHICGGTGKKDGQKCRFCKSGWHEVGGAGMVHPNVLRAGGIDPDEYTGFAFGWGVERTYTLREGLNIDDIRLFYSGDLKFLEQF